jgi:negative regulator of flagellin synthesis FlgM
VANQIKGLDGGSIGSDSSNPVEKVRVSTPVESGGSSAPQSTSQNTSRSDSVHITQSAHALNSLSEAVNDTPDVDTNRVAALQQALSGGTYKVNPERIANNMLQLEQELSQSKRQ